METNYITDFAIVPHNSSMIESIFLSGNFWIIIFGFIVFLYLAFPAVFDTIKELFK